MPDINNLLNNTKHRPWKIPGSNWVYYQEWNNALFLHWKVPFDELRKLVPGELKLDDYNGEYYISLVAFTMQKIHPRYLHPIQTISDFYEINVRTYVNNDGKPGVYFLSIEAEKKLSVIIAKVLSGLPYERAFMKRFGSAYASENHEKNFFFSAKFQTGKINDQKSELDKWLTERYRLYLKKDNGFYYYDIHHLEWEIRFAELDHLKLRYNFGQLDLSSQTPDYVHYSPGVRVLSWQRKKLIS